MAFMAFCLLSLRTYSHGDEAALGASAVVLTKPVLSELAVGRARQVTREGDALGSLVAREPLPDMGVQSLRKLRPGARDVPQLHHGLDALAKLIVRQPEHRGFQNLRMVFENPLDFSWIDVHATRHDDKILPVAKEEIAFLVHQA